jgi:4-hydroxythreonine-4-phosphate dehydrogenase
LHGIDKLDQILPGKINVLNLRRSWFKFWSKWFDYWEYAKSFVAATALKEGVVDVLVTAPINKYNIQSDAFKFRDIRII